MLHEISEGNRVYKDTNRENTWMMYHNHLNIWWEKESQEFLKSLKCPIEGAPNRTWYDRQIKICGENNGKVIKRYQNCLPGDSPELMPLDNHLFADLQEGAGKNVALTYHLKEGDPNFEQKYSFATPRKVYTSLQRTIKAGCPSSSRIAEDINRIFTDTLGRIIDAEGTYIEDESGKSVRHGVRAEAAAAKKRETLPVDAAMMNLFTGMVEKMKEGGGVTFDIAMKEEEEEEEELLATTLERRDTEDGDDDENVDVYEGVEVDEGVDEDEDEQ
jgi:hypothetical protein